LGKNKTPIRSKGKVTISRAAGSVTFPSEFMLVAAINPCPCEYFGDLKRECRCGPLQVQRYRQRISGQLLALPKLFDLRRSHLPARCALASMCARFTCASPTGDAAIYQAALDRGN
jgi:hypothetical protein